MARELAVLLGCLVAAVANTWPMTRDFASRIGGGDGDPFQTIWSWRWMRDALAGLHNPFFTDRVFYPQGASLVFETFDLPTAILAVPLWSVTTPFGVYNAGVLFAFWLTAYGMYRLVEDLTGDAFVAFLAGVLFSATPYHLAHVEAHQHLTSMGWLPLYLLHFHRMLEGRARLRDGVLAGLFLALATLASFYHLLYALVLSAVLFAWAALAHPRALFSRRFAGQAVAVALAFAVLAGPLLFAVLEQRSAEPMVGAHDAVAFSGDVEAFFFPNQAQAWVEDWGGRALHWTGNSAENGLYAGYTLFALALIGLLTGTGRARPYFVLVLLGGLLALGPQLHVGGTVYPDVALPYGLLEKLIPPIGFMGVPVRMGYVMYVGLVVASASALAALRARLTMPGLGAAIAITAATLGLWEYRPRPFIQTDAAEPKPMLEWGQQDEQFTVLDIAHDYRMMWHATLHRKPLVGGYITRVPERLQNWYWRMPLILALRLPGPPVERAFERIDPSLDFPVGPSAPDPRLSPERFDVTWTGTLKVPRAGSWTFYVSSDDGAWLSIDGRQVIDNGGVHPMQTNTFTTQLSAGSHPVQLRAEQFGGDWGLRLEWEGPGTSRRTVASDALVSPSGAPGLHGAYHQQAVGCAIGRDEGRRSLQELGVRYVVTAADDNPCLSRELALPETYRGEGVRIYEVTP